MNSLLTQAIERSLATPEALCVYLKSAPERRHRCGNMFTCVLANFITDEFISDPDTVAAVGQGETYIYVGAKLVVSPHGLNERVVKLNGDDWPINGEKYVVEMPEWCDDLITRFDDLAAGEATSLEVLAEGLVPGCGVEVKHDTTARSDLVAEVEGDAGQEEGSTGSVRDEVGEEGDGS